MFGYATLALLNVAYDGRSVDMMGIVDEGNMVVALGIGGIAALVLAHAINGHRRRRGSMETEGIEEMPAPENSGSRST